MKIKKWLIWTMGSAALLTCLAVVWQAMDTGRAASAQENAPHDSQKMNPGAAPVREGRTVGVVYPARLGDTAAITLPGRARAKRKATLFFRVSGPLLKVHADPGDPVRKGDLLLELDDRDYRRKVRVVESQLKSARANLAKMQTGARAEDIRILEASLDAARADLALARKELERHEILYQNQAVSEQAYDRAKTQVESLSARTVSLEEQLARDRSGARKEDIISARAGIEELEARLAIARDQLGDTRLTAPFDGVVTRRMAEAHEMVVQGHPIMTLDDVSCLEIPVDVPENHVALVLGPGEKNRFLAAFLTVPGKTFPARLTQYSSRADQATGTYEFVFTMTPGPGDLIFPGMTAQICLATSDNTTAHALAIPFQALLGAAGNQARVFVVDPDTRAAQVRNITFESLANTRDVRVLSGLSLSDLVVTQGAAFVRPGQALAFEPPEKKGS